MEAKTLPIFNSEGKEIDTVKLSPAVFDGTINSAAIYQAVNTYRANQRMGLAATKTRGEVSGGGKKPWKQKGTGRARVGSTRSPLWRHGGVIFGPHPKDFSQRLPQKIKNLALKSSLNIKLGENNITVLDELKADKPKTKDICKIFANLKIDTKKAKKSNEVLLLLDKRENGLDLALRNIAFLNVNLAKDVHSYEVMRHRKIIITKHGLNAITDRFK